LQSAAVSRYQAASQFVERRVFMSDPVEIVCNNDGSIRISGDFVIKDATGKEFGLGGRKVISLCRCGHSTNKPFCDGSHARVGFESKIEARDLPPPVPKPR
jgi:CDGSH-type Zn-finger protein